MEIAIKLENWLRNNSSINHSEEKLIDIELYCLSIEPLKYLKVIAADCHSVIVFLNNPFFHDF